MQLFVNEEPVSIVSVESTDSKNPKTQGNLGTVLASIGIPLTKGLAVAVNDEVVPRDFWPEKILSDQDHITLIRPTQGG